ncbi:hypothetical protein BGZ60DRAFT_75942 [Tricladium varicosporioides]|nr:hypothetical protein BGZ60DRAFT_75942 [Hymenoscyphus varicosporioides]
MPRLSFSLRATTTAPTMTLSGSMIVRVPRNQRRKDGKSLFQPISPSPVRRPRTQSNRRVFICQDVAPGRFSNVVIGETVRLGADDFRLESLNLSRVTGSPVRFPQPPQGSSPTTPNCALPLLGFSVVLLGCPAVSVSIVLSISVAAGIETTG